MIEAFASMHNLGIWLSSKRFFISNNFPPPELAVIKSIFKK